MNGFARLARLRVLSPWRAVTIAIIASLLAVGVAAAASGDIDLLLSTDIDPTRGDYGEAIVVDPDGMIIVAGETCPEPGFIGFSDCDIVLLRYRPDLQLDPNFGGDGIQVTNFGGYENVTELDLQSDGRYVIAGNVDDSFFVARFEPGGELDITFNGTGFYRAPGYTPGGLAIQSDGKILVPHWVEDHWRAPLIASVSRLNPNGSPDGSFGNQGTVDLNLGLAADPVSEILVQPDGSIMLAGSAQGFGRPYQPQDILLVRLTSGGELDRSFGERGKQIVDVGGGFLLKSLSQEPAGNLILAGRNFTSETSFYDFALVRVTPNGQLDPTFNGTGLVTTDFTAGEFDNVYDALVQPDGKIIVVGDTIPFGVHTDVALARYEPDGELDLTFGLNGKVIAGIGHTNRGFGIALQPDGKYVITGSYVFYGSSSDAHNILLLRVLP